MSAAAALEDFELRRALRARDAGAIVARFGGLAWRACEGYFLPGGDLEDLQQEARIGIAKAVRDFRGEPAAFPAFAFLCARRQVITAVKTATREKHGPLNYALGIDAPWDGNGGTLAEVLPLHGADPLDALTAREELEGALAVLAGELSEIEREAILAVNVAGIDYERAAAALGLTTKAIDNALQRATRKLRDPALHVRALERRQPRRPRRETVYVPRLERFTPDGVRTKREAIAAARLHLGDDFVTVIRCVKRGISPDGQERHDTRGHPRSDGRRPKAVWRVTLEAPPA